MTTVRIRTATPADAEALLCIYAPYVRDTAITFEYDLPDIPEFTHRIEKTLKSYPYLVAELDGVPVGYAYASPFKERAAYLHSVETTVYVKLGEHGKGIGSALYRELESMLALQNVVNLNACIAYTDTPDTRLDNSSRDFHAKLGYTECARFHKCGLKFGIWYDMIWMEKFIGTHSTDASPFIPFEKARTADRTKAV